MTDLGQSDRSPWVRWQSASEAVSSDLEHAWEAADAAVRVALEYLRNDGGAWLTIDGVDEIDRLLEAIK